MWTASNLRGRLEAPVESHTRLVQRATLRRLPHVSSRDDRSTFLSCGRRLVWANRAGWAGPSVALGASRTPVLARDKPEQPPRWVCLPMRRITALVASKDIDRTDDSGPFLSAWRLEQEGDMTNSTVAAASVRADESSSVTAGADGVLCRYADPEEQAGIVRRAASGERQYPKLQPTAIHALLDQVEDRDRAIVAEAREARSSGRHRRLARYQRTLPRAATSEHPEAAGADLRSRRPSPGRARTRRSGQLLRALTRRASQMRPGRLSAGSFRQVIIRCNNSGTGWLKVCNRPIFPSASIRNRAPWPASGLRSRAGLGSLAPH